MLRFFKNTAKLRQPKSDEQLDRVLDRDFAGLRSVDSETQFQWLRLERMLATHAVAGRSRSPRLIPRLAFVSAIVVAALVGAYLSFAPRTSSPEIFATRKGEQTRLVLLDSSEVTLNYETELTVPKIEIGKARFLSLKGEAFFDVRSNATPFIVSTEVGRVEVIGTEFNVRARDGNLEVAVLEGIVNVTDATSARTLTLTKGQRASCTQGGAVQLIANIPSIEYPGWLYGKLHFEKVPFADACREIEMRFDVVINIENASVRNEIVTGMLNAKDAESALTALCGLTGKKFRRDGKTYNIY